MIREALRIHEKTIAKSLIAKEYLASASQRPLLKTTNSLKLLQHA